FTRISSPLAPVLLPACFTTDCALFPASLCDYGCCHSAWADRESRHPGRVGLAPTSLKQL
ncbi:MAG: hypothetical protein AAF063_20290, partial [Cyanobacteria bacterium J06643_5]